MNAKDAKHPRRIIGGAAPAPPARREGTDDGRDRRSDPQAQRGHARALRARGLDPELPAVPRASRPSSLPGQPQHRPVRRRHDGVLGRDRGADGRRRAHPALPALRRSLGRRRVRDDRARGGPEPTLPLPARVRAAAPDRQDGAPARAERFGEVHARAGARARLREVLAAEDEGALFRFNWIFSEATDRGESLGFHALAPDDSLDSFAFLEAERISAKIPSDMHDHPLLLIPRHQRMELLQGMLAEADEAEREKFLPTRFLTEGELSPSSARSTAR